MMRNSLRSRRSSWRYVAFLLAAGLCAELPSIPRATAANWAVTRVNHVLLTPPGGVSAGEMSGLTYLGPAAGGAHRFIVVEKTVTAHHEFLQIDVSFDAAGAITGITNVTPINVNPVFDFEGVAYTNPARNSVFASEENGPNIREINLANGTSFQNLSSTIPSVFSVNKRPNRGFESLTRSPDGTVMWTANEQALTVDGGESTPTTGTTVRLLKLNVSGNAVSAGPQFSYVTGPIHNGSPLGSPQNGLCELVCMPDGTLLALERSVAVASPIYLNRIYEVGFAGATDVSQGDFDAGLAGQTYTPVGKELLWSGAADGGAGQNLEGLALGPRLANGSWVLLGVVDDGFPFGGSDSDPLSNNTFVAFTATSITNADFSADGAVDGADMLLWQRGLGKTIGALHGEGDADRDGDVDPIDLQLWKAGVPADKVAAPTPEPQGAALGAIALGSAATRRRRPGRA